MKNIGILIFDQAEELDFVGPLEVFGMTSKLQPNSLHSFIVQQEAKVVKAVNGLRVIPELSATRYNLDTKRNRITNRDEK